MDIIYIILLVALGIFMIVKPDIVWKMQIWLFIKDASPTPLFYIAVRSAGILSILFAIFYAVSLLWG